MTVTSLQDRTRTRIEDLFWLDEQDTGMPEVLQRLNLTEDALEGFCASHGLEALFQRARHRGHACASECPLTLPKRPDPVLFLGIRNRNIPPRDQREWVTSVELQTEAGITYRQLDYWTRTGLLTTIFAPDPGSGSARCFHVDQVARASTLADLLDLGMSLQACRVVIDAMLTDGQITVAGFTITRNQQEATA